jgi:hypothetical protein
VVQDEPVKPVTYVRLPEIIYEKLRSLESVEVGANPIMAKVILVALLHPGESVRMFGSNYHPDDTLTRYVVRQWRSRVKEPFDKREYRKTLRWLEAKGIIIANWKKRDQAMYSLAPSPTYGQNSIAKEIIKEVIGLAQSFNKA